jgi:hypothetical protein
MSKLPEEEKFEMAKNEKNRSDFNSFLPFSAREAIKRSFLLNIFKCYLYADTCNDKNAKKWATKNGNARMGFLKTFLSIFLNLSCTEF